MILINLFISDDVLRNPPSVITAQNASRRGDETATVRGRGNWRTSCVRDRGIRERERRERHDDNKSKHL